MVHPAEQPTYIDEVRRHREDAVSLLTRLQREVARVQEQFQAVADLVRAYDTVLEKSSVVEDATLRLTVPMPLDGDATPDTEGEGAGGIPDNVNESRDDDAGRSHAPERRPEFQHVTLPQALATLLERPEFQQVLTVDAYVDAVYLIESSRERVTAKRTFNGELSRAVQRGILERTSRGRFRPPHRLNAAHFEPGAVMPAE